MKRVVMVGLVLILVVATAPMVTSAQTISYWSGIQITNLSDKDASVVIKFYNRDGTIAATIRVTVLPNDIMTYGTLDDWLNEGSAVSAVISSDQPVAAIVNTMGNGLDYGAASLGFSEGASQVRLPLIMKDNYGYYTWYKVQNVSGSEDAVVSVTYSNGITESVQTIPPGAAHAYHQDELPDGFVGSATVTSTGGKIAATVVEVGPTTLFVYNGFVGGATNPSMPLVQQNNYGYVTGIQIMNVGTVSTTVTVGYTAGAAGTDTTETKDIDPGASATFDMAVGGVPYLGGMEVFIGSAAVVTNTASQELVVVVNQLNHGQNKGAAYSGFAPANATDTLCMPLIMDRNYNYFTGCNIVNAGDLPTNITIECTGDLPSMPYPIFYLDPGDAITIVHLDQMADGYVGSCIAKAEYGGKILGICNELNSAASGDAFLVYEAINF